MNAYTVSRLALDAGVSVHIVRDYLLRGLLRPVACTTGGYGLFDDAALQRLCFVRAAFEAGIGLGALARLCRALDAANCDETAAQLAVLRQFVERRREALALYDQPADDRAWCNPAAAGVCRVRCPGGSGLSGLSVTSGI